MPTFTGGPYRFVRLGLAGALLALALVAAGCGSGGSLALDPVASAANRTLGKETGRFETTFGFGLGEVTASGKFSAPDEAFEITMNVPGPTDALHPVEVRMKYPTIWVRGAQQLPSSKTWLKFDLRKALNKLGLSSSSAALGLSQSPAHSLAQLLGSKNAKKLGSETIDGVETTHYRVTVDLQDAVAKATPKERQSLQSLLGLAKEHRLQTAGKIDVWVGDDGLVRRTVQTFGNFGAVTTNFLDLGMPVQIEAPPEKHTIDVATLIPPAG